MVWHKPLLSTYSDNYRYGTGLYSNGGTYSMEDAEKKYRDTLSRTNVRSDRGDLGMYSFVGSHVHGGSPAAEPGKMSVPPPSPGTTNNLYEPLSFGYGRNYYNNLRADYQKPKARDVKMPSAADYFSAGSTLSGGSEPLGADLKTHTAKSKTTYDDAKKTVTTTTTTERWVPLSNYLYGYPAYYYHYSTPTVRTSKTTDDVYYSSDTVDDYYKSTTTTSKSRTLDALDLNVSSNISKSSMDKFDYNMWMEKCRDIHNHIEQVNRWIADAEAKIKTDVVGARNKMQTELTEVTLLVEDTTKYNEELQRVIKRQARQISDLHSQYDEINRHLVDVNDTLEKSRVRCQTLASDLASVQAGLELAARRK